MVLFITCSSSPYIFAHLYNAIDALTISGLSLDWFVPKSQNWRRILVALLTLVLDGSKESVPKGRPLDVHLLQLIPAHSGQAKIKMLRTLSI